MPTNITRIAVAIVTGVFVMGLLAFFTYLAIKFLPLKKWATKIILNIQKKKLLKDEKLLEYCVKRVNRNWTEQDVRAELLLENKFTTAKIEQVAYVYNIVYNELKGGGHGTSEGQRGTKGKTTETYPE